MEQLIIVWDEQDIRDLKPEWSKRQCAEFFENNAKYIKDLSIQRGFEIIDELISMDTKSS